MNDRSSLSAYARTLAATIEEVFGVALSPAFIRAFVFEAFRVGPDEYEDLGQWLLLECHEMQQAGEPVSEQTVKRAVRRLRERLVRAARRQLAMDPSVFADVAADDRGNASLSEIERRVRRIMDKLSPDEALVLHLSMAEGQGPREIAESLGVSLATVYRRLEAVRDRISEES